MTEPEITEQLLTDAGYAALSLAEIEALLRQEGYDEQMIQETLSFVIEGRERLRRYGRALNVQ